MNTIKRIGDGWYSFKELDQSQRYIKIDALNCQTDRKAINQAKKIIGDPKATITIED